MSELGARLRQARESQGLSLAQASSDTRIQQVSLDALEEGAYQRLPGDVVIRGFIRNYANYLGQPADELIELYRRERGATDQIRIVPATNPPRTRSYVLPGFFGVFFVTVALIGMTYITLNAVGRIGDRTDVALAVATATIAPPPPPLPTATLGVAPTMPVPPRPQPTSNAVQANPAGGVAPTLTVPETSLPSPAPAAPIVLELQVPSVRGSESSWVRVQADGNTVYEGIMRAGETLSFTAQRRVIVRAGNPPDVLVSVNGLQQGSIGQNSGQPVNWSWPPN